MKRRTCRKPLPDAGASRQAYDRSAVMRAVKSRDTGPERAVRAMLRTIAPGYRLCRADLPGSRTSPMPAAGSRSSCTAASGMGTTARAARACRKPTPTIGAPKSPATGRATRPRSPPTPRWAGGRWSSTSASSKNRRRSKRGSLRRWAELPPSPRERAGVRGLRGLLPAGGPQAGEGPPSVRRRRAPASPAPSSCWREEWEAEGVRRPSPPWQRNRAARNKGTSRIPRGTG